jgi:hypothetical protein
MADYDYDVEYSHIYSFQSPNPGSVKQGQQAPMTKKANKSAMLEKLKELASFDPDFKFSEDDIADEDEPEDAIVGGITQPVHIGEKCTIEFAKRLNIFDNNNYILDLEQDELDKLNTYKLDDDGKLETSQNRKYNICQVKDEIAYENCALATSNLYLTTSYDSATKSYVCTIPDKMKLPGNSKYQFVQTSTSNIIKPESEIYLKNLKKNFCEERWHDWFCIPNYHLGNRWYNELPAELNPTKSIGKCFKPCKFSYMPTEENVGKCVLKKQYNGGVYKYDFDYTPIALVCLIGTTFDIFKTEYTLFLNEMKTSYDKSTDTELLKKANQDVIENIITTIGSKENVIWQSISNDIKTYINDIFASIPDMNNDIINANVVAPTQAIQSVMATFLKPSTITHAYNIAKGFNNIVGDMKLYKVWVAELQSITGLPKDKLIYLIRMFKRACNICFDGKNPAFSKDYLLFAIKQDPVTIDELYEPLIDEIKVNDFNYLQKKERYLLDDYATDFASFRDAIYTYLYFVVLVILILALYIIYIVFYQPINALLNSLITLLVFTYFDIKYYIYRYLINSFAVDDREYQKLDFIRKLYQTFIDYDNNTYLR